MESYFQTNKKSWIESSFYNRAFKILIESREVLKWSYVVAFFLEAGNDSHIFEGVQSGLEMATEKLNELLETEIYPETVDKLKWEIINASEFALDRKRALQYYS
ncbi:E3 ubiquitin-protein ligase arih1 [Smittium culicis]|uniref:E3 ubiquitin-protein ligase arih1 n=1 Tax=Smittium culicis TaxID=133412 RepID=A0A1R1XVV5_9FUNG|nr:E3 ubiquitin-protein ligase arih1 [Smittium culicis]